MLLQESILKRYTPPTCTLQILVTNFSLSRWLGKIREQDIYFELRIDDPRLPESKKVKLQGNYQQLQTLCQRVTSYVESWLQFTDIPLQPTNSNPQKQLAYLENQGLLRHQLVWKGLDSQTINLSPSQLFDLANALSDFQAEITNYLSPKKLSQSTVDTSGLLKKWTIAGLCLVMGGIVFTYLNPKQEQDNSDKLADNSATPVDPSLENIITVQLPSQNLEKPQPTLPESLVSTPRLLPPATVTQPERSPSPTSPQSRVSTASDADSATTTSETKDDQPVPRRRGSLSLSQFSSLYAQPPKDTVESQPQQSPSQEVKDYFTQNWQPPEDLSEKLEYRLLIDSQGKLLQIIPLGRAATVYLDSLPLPSADSPLIGPWGSEENLSVRLVLSPDGLVEALADSRVY